MAAQQAVDGHKAGRRDRRFEVIVALLFVLMLVGGVALFPFSVAANKLSGLWITLCASIGFS
ncbi:hypothetical protein BAL199_18911 [alpha proteobacterium BAL199]|jgi:hypothetical protein|nr:hypothetical protein BAL199_18911 [alpha proteobacterium BAL199]